MRILNKIKDMTNVLFVFFKKLNENRVLVYASSAAYYFFVSIIPLLMILYFMLSYTSVGVKELVSMINSVLPDGVNIFAETVMTELSGHSKAHMSFAVILIIWSASRGVVALSNGLNIIYGVERKRDGKDFALFQLKSMFYTVLFMVLVIAWLLIMTISKDMIGVVGRWLPRVGVFMEFWMRKRHLVSLLTMTGSILLMYLLLPEKKIATVKKEGGIGLVIIARLIGAFVAAFLWTLFAMLFSWWIHNYATLTIYGSLATIVLSLYWIYLGMIIIMVGAQISRFIRHLLMWFRTHRDLPSVRTALSVMGTQVKYKGVVKNGISFIGKIYVSDEHIAEIAEDNNEEKIVFVMQRIEVQKLSQALLCRISAIAAKECDNELRLMQLSEEYDFLVILECDFGLRTIEKLDDKECYIDGESGSLYINPYPWTRV